MSVSRLTLPENFYDVTSSQLLAQPEPQYLFARLFLDAMAIGMPMPGNFGLDGRQPPDGLAKYSSAERDRLAVSPTMLPSSLFSVGIDFAKTPGNTVRVNRPAFINSTYTLQSRKIATGQPISTTPMDFGSEQTHLILERYAGPYGGSAVQPFAIESFDANMGVFSAQSMVSTQLTRDFHRFLDSVHVTLASAGTAIYPDGSTADNDSTTVGAYPMTLEQLSRTEATMDAANLPTLPDACRLLVLHPNQWKQLKHDPEYEQQAQFMTTWNTLYPGYVGTVGKFHIFKSTTVNAPTNSSSVPVYQGLAIAPGAFMAGMGRPPHVATSTDDNYGETIKAVWLADLAFGLADQRFIYTVRSS